MKLHVEFTLVKQTLNLAGSTSLTQFVLASTRIKHAFVVFCGTLVLKIVKLSKPSACSGFTTLHSSPRTPPVMVRNWFY